MGTLTALRREAHVHSTVTSTDIFLRLAAAVAAGTVIGFDRGSRGHIAGLRTTILLCLAAAGAMIEANLTLSVVGKSNESFTVMDALRFPLGILSGIGFIGAGVILKRGELVTGVTTAATMWLTTVIGLIFGGGYFLLGGSVVMIAMIVLSLVVYLEPLMRRQHRADLLVELAPEGPADDDVRNEITGKGYRITSIAATMGSGERRLDCRVTWNSSAGPTDVPEIVRVLSCRPGVTKVEWRPLASGQHAD
jgi:putative Mg2+ transporter-C (MgtC) family protein